MFVNKCIHVLSLICSVLLQWYCCNRTSNHQSSINHLVIQLTQPSWLLYCLFSYCPKFVS